MKGHGSKFDRLKDEAVAALLSHRSIEEAAQDLGVDAATLSRWMKDKNFLESLEGAKKLMYTDAIERLREHAGAAATTILKVMVDPKAPHSARLKAAGIVLDKAEITKDFEHRLAKMEALIRLFSRLQTPSPDAADVKSTPLLELPAVTPQNAEEAIDPAEDDEDDQEESA